MAVTVSNHNKYRVDKKKRYMWQGYSEHDPAIKTGPSVLTKCCSCYFRQFPETGSSFRKVTRKQYSTGFDFLSQACLWNVLIFSH